MGYNIAQEEYLVFCLNKHPDAKTHKSQRIWNRRVMLGYISHNLHLPPGLGSNTFYCNPCFYAAPIFFDKKEVRYWLIVVYEVDFEPNWLVQWVCTFALFCHPAWPLVVLVKRFSSEHRRKNIQTDATKYIISLLCGQAQNQNPYPTLLSTQNIILAL